MHANEQTRTKNRLTIYEKIVSWYLKALVREVCVAVVVLCILAVR